MKKQILLFLTGLCLALPAAPFPLGGFRLRLYSCRGAVISTILSDPSRLIRHTGTLHEQVWASGRFTVRCRISKNLPGEYWMQWRIKAQNGIPEGAFFELSCRAEPEWHIQRIGTKLFLLTTPEQNWLCRTENALMPVLASCGSETGLRWYWNYNPLYINTIDFILEMREER